MIMAVSDVPMQYVRVEKSDTCGRKLVATSRFPPGKCILEELPYAYTLCDNKRGLHCDFCLKQCSTLKKCTRCKYVSYCNKSCQEGDWVRCHKHDCKTLKKYPVTVIHLLSQFIRKQGTQDDEECFPTTVDQLESHHDKLSDTMRAKLEIVKSRIEEDVRTEPISSARFFKMFGAHTCNSFSMLNNNMAVIAVGIYLRASMVNHSCDPNCDAVFDGRTLQLRTIKDVKEGEECSICYVEVINPAKERQAELEKKYYFTCKCVKCVEEINALKPENGLGEELRDLKKSLEQIKDAEKAQDWAKVLQLCKPYLKQMDSASSLPANHHLLFKVRDAAFLACIDSQAWQKAFETGQLNMEPFRYHYGPYNAYLGIYLLRMTNILLGLGRLEEAIKYFTETKNVLEVTHGPKHSLMLEMQTLFSFLEILKT